MREEENIKNRIAKCSFCARGLSRIIGWVGGARGFGGRIAPSISFGLGRKAKEYKDRKNFVGYGAELPLHSHMFEVR